MVIVHLIMPSRYGGISFPLLGSRTGRKSVGAMMWANIKQGANDLWKYIKKHGINLFNTVAGSFPRLEHEYETGIDELQPTSLLEHEYELPKEVRRRRKYENAAKRLTADAGFIVERLAEFAGIVGAVRKEVLNIRRLLDDVAEVGAKDRDLLEDEISRLADRLDEVEERLTEENKVAHNLGVDANEEVDLLRDGMGKVHVAIADIIKTLDTKSNKRGVK